jgi:hypothetical protein
VPKGARHLDANSLIADPVGQIWSRSLSLILHAGAVPTEAVCSTIRLALTRKTSRALSRCGRSKINLPPVSVSPNRSPLCRAIFNSDTYRFSIDTASLAAD